MHNLILLNKKPGKTPLSAIEDYKAEHPEYRDTKMTYAGRLDPMAEGLLIVLAGDKVHEKEQFLALDKTYQIDVLFGFETDTYDVLGKVLKKSVAYTLQNQDIETMLQRFVGPFEQTYPLFSSKTVGGKPLWQYARDKEVPEIPTKPVEIYEISNQGQTSYTGRELEQYILGKIRVVQGDFRQAEIVATWQESLQGLENHSFLAIRLLVSCSSGTYMRSLAHHIGLKIGVPALALAIKRIKIGEFELDK